MQVDRKKTDMDARKTAVVGYWMSQKKLKKLCIAEFVKYCALHDIQLVELDLDTDISLQGPFHAILHKLSDVWTAAEVGDNETAKKRWANVQQYTSAHPEVVVIDQFESVRQLCDRFLQYSMMSKVCKAAGGAIVSPDFAVLDGCDVKENARKLRDAGIHFPIICKPLQAHGSQMAHRMMLIFCEKGLKDVQPPCVAQAFVPHNAVLYKLYVIGDRYFPMARPSLKNFTASEQDTIFFDSQNISKNGCEENELTKMAADDTAVPPDANNNNGGASQSPTGVVMCTDNNNLDEQAEFGDQVPPPDRTVRALVDEMRARTGLANFGMDLIVERAGARRCMVIDVNCFPDVSCLCCEKKIFGDECECNESGFTAQNPPAFFTYLMEMIKAELPVDDTRQSSLSPTPPSTVSLIGQTRSAVDFRHLFLDSGIGSATSSESETSDCDKARRLQTESKKVLGFPDWTRIKQFYGIPKPMFELPPRPARPTKRQQQGAIAKLGAECAKPITVVADLQQLQETKNRSETVP